jgi:hypothetical protein
VAAGLLLIEAKSRVPIFEDFLRGQCNGLSRSCAHTLIDIANGKIDEVRAKARARKLKYRQKQATKEADVRSGTDTNFSSSELSQEALLAQFENEFEVWLKTLDDGTLKHAVSYVLRRSNDRNPALDLTASVVQ